MKTFKILGLLLSYPKLDLLNHLDDLEQGLSEEGQLSKKQLKGLFELTAYLKSHDSYQVQENYVETFDRGRANSLHLFEHIFGESRDRGQAMVNLVEAYEEKGLYIDRAELPDYIPMFLEYLSLCRDHEAVELLGEPIDVIAVIGTRLQKSGSLYAAIFDALVALSKQKPDREKIQEALDQQSESQTPEAIDKEWEEAAAFGGAPNQSDCGSCSASTSQQQHVSIN